MMGSVPPAHLVSLGYEGRTADELISAARRANVTVLVDVRQTPLSRKPGLSKRRLAAALEDAGIEYVHLRALGNPKENRAPFREGQPSSHRLFRSLLGAEDGAAAIQRVADLLDDEIVALLCFEREHNACHRHLVAEALREARPGLSVLDV
jgi:uncharacterized protein (DUF488 family)